MTMKVNCCFGIFHKWIVIRDTGKTCYRECRRCSKRDIKQRVGGYQPIDREWCENVQRGIVGPTERGYKIFDLVRAVRSASSKSARRALSKIHRLGITKDGE